MEDKIIELADYFISENTTYREAKIACEKLLKQVSHEIELRALESRTRVIKLLQFIKQDHPNPSEYMKPRVKALAELTSEDIRDYDLKFAPSELVSQLRDLQSSF